MKLRHTAAAAATLTVGGLLAAAPVAFAEDNPQIVKVETHVACGTVTVNMTNADDTPYVWQWTTGPVDGGPIGETGQFNVPLGESTKTIKLPEDSFGGRGFVTLQALSGSDAPLQPVVDLGLVKTDCDDTPPVTYPADCEIGAGIDNGESGKQADADAPCVSNSPGYETDEVGKQCDVTSGEIGGGEGVVTEALKCEVPASDGDEQGTDDGTDPADNGDTDDPAGNDDQGTDDNGGVDNGSDNGSADDDGLNPGPITAINGETVYVPSGGVETGGGPA